MSKEVKVPRISEDADSGTVADIYVKEGDTIEEGQDIIGMESDKASVDVPSDAAGKVKSIEVSEGDELSVGDVILILEEEEGSHDEGSENDDSKDEDDSGKEKKSEKDKEGADEDSDSEEDEDSDDSEDDSGEEKDSDKKEKGKNSEDAEEDSDEEEEPDDDDEKKKPSEDKEDTDEEGESDEDAEQDDDSGEGDESKKDTKDSKDEGKSASKEEDGDDKDDDGSPTAPLAKKFARELGIDISDLQGDDPEKRITRDDVMAYAKKIIAKKGEGSPASGGGIESIKLPDFSQWGETERKPLSGIRTAVAKNTRLSWQNIPHVTHHDRADLTELHEFLEKSAEDDGEKLSMTAVLTKIAVEALKQFPKFNASLDLPNKEVVYKKYYHISIAVDTDNGLMMPVMKDVDQKPVKVLSEELSKLAEKARSQDLKPEEMKGGNFAISNLGGIGGTSFTPVIFPPQGAILGVSSSSKEAVWKDGEFEAREMLPLSLSYDHRLIDGAEAARFLRWICEVIEQPFNLLTR